jgi:hypothetical protein
MLDFIVAVDNSVDFHRVNLEMNPNHYSGLGCLGYNVVSWFQESFGAKALYNFASINSQVKHFYKAASIILI